MASMLDMLAQVSRLQHFERDLSMKSARFVIYVGDAVLKTFLK